jgi:two-component system nitrogen regulation sensor histidine kinase NtrY
MRPISFVITRYTSKTYHFPDMIKRVLLYVVVLFILLAVALSAGQQDGTDALLQEHSEEISSWLGAQEQEAVAWANNTANLSNDRIGQADKAYTILIHRGDSLLFWSNTKIIPAPRDLKNLTTKTGTTLIHLPLGWFLGNVSQQGSDTRSILIPIRYALNFNEPGHTVAFPANKNISENLLVSEEKTDWPITVNAKELCWLQADGPLQLGWLSWIKLGAWLLFFITLLGLLNQSAQWLNRRFGVLTGAIMLLAVIGGLLYYNLQTGWTTAQFGALPLFQQNFDSASLIGSSVGDWLIHVALLVFLMGVFHQSFIEKPLSHLPSGIRIGIAFLSNVLAMLSIPLCVLVAKQLIFRSRLGFDFDNILGIGTAGFLTLVGIIGLMVGLFLFGHRLMLTVRSLALSRTARSGAIAGAVAALALVSIPLGINPVYVALFALLYAAAMDLFVHWEGHGFGWVVVWVLLFSVFASTLLYQYNEQHDQNQRSNYAQALASARDTASAEYLLPKFLAAIQLDSSAISQTLKPWPFKANQSELITQLNAIALQSPYLFQHYRLKVAAFDNENQPILLGQTFGYQEVVNENWANAQALNDNGAIRYHTSADGTFRYILRFTLSRAADVTQRVQLFVFLDHAHPAPTLAYTQIFYNSPYKNLDHLSRYQFAVQKNGRILVEQGRGSLAALSTKLEKGETIELETTAPHRVDAVSKSADGQTIASVGRSLGGWLKQMYLFSILFTLTSLLLLALAFVNSWLNFLPEVYDFRLSAKGSLARRIHLWNVSLLAASFLVVGFLTYRHFTSTARETEQVAFDYRTEVLQNNQEAPFLSVVDSSSEKSRSATLTNSLQKITTSLGVDANFFSPDGELLFTTQKDLVSLGILPSKMNVAAQEILTKRNLPEVEEKEQVGGNEYLTKYRPCRDGRGELLGFLGVPHQPSQGTIGADVSDFIGMLASLYVFLLLIAYAITFVLARSIIRPLSLLSEKVQELKLEDKNAPLEYAGDAQDEISELIGQYNTMVQKLENSKVQLVRLEREGAWREMAKQIAHDIKNPLTTMKLSMQQLERVSSNPEQAAAYLRKVITRLIEQIDSLAQIASEFSMFANLEIRNKSSMVINEVVESVHDLFSEQNNVALELVLPKELYHILGDKNHLIRVFNNLVINAIQSIPSDRQGHVKVSLVRDGNMAVVQISDNGGGIPPEIGERVFEPNFTTKTSGSGLGLAICKKIIEAHDGNIRFETRENEGTDFFVEIPQIPS